MNVLYLNTISLLVNTLCPLVYKLYKGIGIKCFIVCEAPPPSFNHLLLNASSGTQTDENQKMPDTGYKLDGMELHNSMSIRWSQYGQQMKM
jgi:hypothetical protein